MFSFTFWYINWPPQTFGCTYCWQFTSSAPFLILTLEILLLCCDILFSLFSILSVAVIFSYLPSMRYFYLPYLLLTWITCCTLHPGGRAGIGYLITEICSKRRETETPIQNSVTRALNQLFGQMGQIPVKDYVARNWTCWGLSYHTGWKMKVLGVSVP